MNTPSNTVPQSHLDPQAVTPTTMSETRPLYWSIRRELWENRSIYIAPLVVAGVVLLGFLIATIGRAVATADPAQRAAVLVERNNFAAGVIMATAFIVGVFYCVDALQGERHRIVLASKFGIVGLSECLRQEVRDAEEIHVCTILAPSADTPTPMTTTRGRVARTRLCPPLRGARDERAPRGPPQGWFHTWQKSRT